MMPALVFLNFLLASIHIYVSHGIPHTSMNLRANQNLLLHKKEPDICKPSNATDETLWIAMPAWNETNALKTCIESISAQVNTGFQNIHIVVFEDYSVDMLTKSQKDAFEKDPKLQFSFLSNEGPEKHGSAYGKWKLFEYIREHAKPYEYTLIVDGDDQVAHIDTIGYIYKRLKESKAWFAWGRHNGKYSEQCKPLQWPKMRLSSSKSIRNAIWSFCHPRMFRSHLLHSLSMSEFQRDNGEWLQKATDRPFIFKFMEMAGQDRIEYIGDQRALYNYTFDSRNGLKVFKKEVIQGDKELVNHRPSAPRPKDVIHVISCVYDRQNTKEFFEKLASSVLPKNHEMKIHICNNNAGRQKELTRTAAEVSQKAKDPNKLSIDIVDMKKNHGGYSRFLLAKQLMEKEFLEYVIMIDDDQYVHPDTIADIYSKREPQTYKAWFGKTWRKHDRDYWSAFPSIISRPWIRSFLRWDVTRYQYGGTGMSIIDANIFLFKLLYDLDEKYGRLEDMWLSHIVNIQGWKISRLFLYFDEYAKEADSGQYPTLKELKNEFFAKVNYFQCGTGNKVSDITEGIWAKQVYALYFILLVLFLFGSRHCSKKRHRFKGLKKN
ncbi:hypothetical protein CTEN210_18486 [Chaetoceros tenuissimus]|uniref:Glycosyltransferase 2-like domain-containing protein n=1 Tax=Chaetoceros tenuissimus TaxID=426638 RepID=A0AAD3DEP7_9STRA|nr:hypothetical protein CTEN210_18486 [Chaetoceros tenuissimus]